MMEEWRNIPIEGFEHYLVSNVGRVSNGKKIMKHFLHPDGYHRICLSSKGKQKKFAIHRLVAYAFIGMPDSEDMQVNHINSKVDDNRPENLEWVTPRENIIHGCVYGRIDVERLKKQAKYANKKACEVRREKVVLIDPNDNKLIFNSVVEAAEKTGLDKRAIGAVARGNRKAHKGYKAYYLKAVV